MKNNNNEKYVYGEYDRHEFVGMPDTPENRKKAAEGFSNAIAFAEKLKRKHKNEKTDNRTLK